MPLFKLKLALWRLLLLAVTFASLGQAQMTIDDGCTVTQWEECKTECGDLLKTCACPGGTRFTACYDPPPTIYAPSPADDNTTVYIAVGASVGGCLFCLVCCYFVWRMLPDAQQDDILDMVSSRREGGNVVQLKESDIM